MARNIRIRDNNRIPQAIRNINGMNTKKAKVGYLSDGQMKMIAVVHEYGMNIQVTDKMRKFLASQGLRLRKDTTHIRIPERSFIRSGADQHERDVIQKADQLICDVIENRIPVALFYEMLGLELKGKIQEFAVDLREPANHPFTIDRKNSSNPLVDSGDMIQSMEVEVD